MQCGWTSPGVTVEGRLYEEVLAPKTYAYFGERAIAVKTRTLGSDGGPAVTVEGGDVPSTVRAAG